MARSRPLKPLAVSQDTRGELESLARSRSLPAGLVRRAGIVLLCAEGLDNATVAERVRVSRQTVGKWRERFRTQGLMGLYDEHRPGRPRSIPDDTVMTLLRKTLETRPPDGGTREGVLLVDTADMPKQGVHSVGVAPSHDPGSCTSSCCGAGWHSKKAARPDPVPSGGGPGASAGPRGPQYGRRPLPRTATPDGTAILTSHYSATTVPGCLILQDRTQVHGYLSLCARHSLD